MAKILKALASCTVLLAALAYGADVRNASAKLPSTDRSAFDQVVEAACGKSIVMLGEATHGDGHTDEIKVALVKHLVSNCGFNLVLFEASFYEFEPIARAALVKKPVSPTLIGAAVGGLWKFDKEVQPLFEFLAERVDSGKVHVGGLDFQAGGFEQPFTNDELPNELARYLPAPRRELCQQAYRSQMYGSSPPDGMSEGARKVALQACLLEIEKSLPTRVATPGLDGLDGEKQMLKNLTAWLASDGSSWPQRLQARDKMMAENVGWFLGAAGKASKTLIWTANGHAARSVTALGDYESRDNLGRALSRQHGDSMYSLGVSACAGEYRWSHGSNKAIPAPPPGSLEAATCNQSAAVTKFLGATALGQLGTRQAGLMGHTYKAANWAEAFDGILVLDAERAPQSTR